MEKECFSQGQGRLQEVLTEPQHRALCLREDNGQHREVIRPHTSELGGALGMLQVQRGGGHPAHQERAIPKTHVPELPAAP
jgi:hypothetical protein